MNNKDDKFKKVISHAKEYGYIFQSSEIYDGLSAVYDYAQNGVELKNNIKEYWWKAMVQLHENIVGLDSAIFMHPKTWKASGHVDAFNDFIHGLRLERTCITMPEPEIYLLGNPSTNFHPELFHLEFRTGIFTIFKIIPEGKLGIGNKINIRKTFLLVLGN